MKHILISIAVFFSLSANAQTDTTAKLDTVIVRNLQMQSQDWAWLIGRIQPIDSTTILAFRMIRTRIRVANPANWTTNVTIDSLPGPVVVAFYRAVKHNSAGEIAARYAGITNAILGKANLLRWVAPIDNAFSGEYIRQRNQGKWKILDN